MLLGFDKATQTFLLVLFTLFVFYIVPLTYRGIKEKNYQRLQGRNLLLDWHVLVLCIVYAVIFGFRYDYLNDWEQYVKYYEYIQNGGLNDGWHEPGFYWFIKGLTLLGFNYYSMFFIECFLWIYSLCYLFKDNRKYLICVLPFVFLTTTDESLNVSRQYFAMSFLLIAFRDYWDGKRIRALVFAVIAPLMHFSSIIWVIVFFFLKKVEYIKPAWTVTAFIGVTIASSLFFDVLASSTEFISTLSSVYFENKIYDSSEIEALQAETTGATLRQMLTLGLTRGFYLFLYYYFRKRNLFANPIINNIALIGVLGIIVVLLMGYNLVFSRIAAYIRLFYHIGWGIFIYIAIIQGKRYVSAPVKILFVLALLYLVGAGIMHFSPSRREMITDTNPYIIYDIRD